jgi:hypothetical protein
VHRVGRYQIIIDYHEGRKGCMHDSLEYLSFVAKIKLRKDRDFKEFEGKKTSKSSRRNRSQEER